MIGQGLKKLTPDYVFKKLVEKGVFRVGLNFRCPNCELEFWLSLDDIATITVCEYCGNNFNCTTQLKDRDWFFRSSGLFAEDNHQEGAIPVIVTLQQMDTHLSMNFIRGWSLFHTAMNLTGEQIQSCESDLIMIGQNSDGEFFLVISECKGNKDITDDDLAKLASVVNSLPKERVRSYILFSKSSTFSDDEIQRLKRMQMEVHQNIILLSVKELEPYHIYENAPKSLNLRPLIANLDEMVDATKVLFFQ